MISSTSNSEDRILTEMKRRGNRAALKAGGTPLADDWDLSFSRAALFSTSRSKDLRKIDRRDKPAKIETYGWCVSPKAKPLAVLIQGAIRFQFRVFAPGAQDDSAHRRTCVALGERAISQARIVAPPRIQTFVAVVIGILHFNRR
jgi:hypothetical protein